ncbi:hypothetical protein [Burkholderia sp. SCN-KJ]|uniref:hypothetical protein n=1 Tax=Burkholderia sp. SCN-KJ TaxID=2969248 RepID=UPI00215066FA|nr:hypothetical protein [Burkholderia sp. SCN-KJ]MCR4468607.1 hypothetical protein [Burkholderia sp. SCN-KJ]
MTGEPDAHDITMKHRPRVPCGDVGASSSISSARVLRIRRCTRRIVADGTISGSRARTGFSARRTGPPMAHDRPAAIDAAGATLRSRTRVPPATARRSSSESRYKKSNKQFMREIL